ncbi:MAG: autotransporter outer membrane beta-barrel domain-containing protein [Rickettsiaceae bacterium]|nr:MAG: autotransporter outer membrane beta-barrel domain-containing protein [Rickettsiaceae bacterium]
MAKNPKFLKKLLTTASAISIVALSASSAMAAPNRNTIASPANLGTGAGFNQIGGVVTPVESKSLIIIDANNRIVDFNKGPGTYFFVDNQNRNDTVLNVVAPGVGAMSRTILLGIANSVEASRVKINAGADNTTIEIGRNGLFAAANFTAEALAVMDKFAPSVVDLKATNGSRVYLNNPANNEMNIHFEAVDPAQVALAVIAAPPVRVGDHGGLNIQSSTTLTGGFGEKGREIGSISLNNDNAQLTLVRNVVALAESKARVAAARAAGAGPNGTVPAGFLEADVKDLMLSRGISSPGNNTVVVTTTDYDMDVPSINGVSLQLGGNSVIKGLIGDTKAVGNIDIAGAHTAEFQGGAPVVGPAVDMKFAAVNLGDAASKIKLSGNVRSAKGNIVNSSAMLADGSYADAGIVQLDGNNAFTIDGHIGAVDKKLAAIQLTTAGPVSALHVNNNVYADAITTNAANTGRINVQNTGADITIDSNIGTDAAGGAMSGLTIENPVIAGAPAIAGKVIIGDNRTLHLGDISTGVLDNTLVIGNGVTIHGGLKNNAPGVAPVVGAAPVFAPTGHVVFNGDATVDGKVAYKRAFNDIKVLAGIVDLQGYAGAGAVPADHVVNFNTLDIAAGAELKLSTNDRHLMGNITGGGTLNLDGAHAYEHTGNIGVDAANKLGAISFTNAGAGAAGKGLNVSGNLAANAIATNVNNTGIVKFDGNVNHDVAVDDIGTSGARIENIGFTNAGVNSNITLKNNVPVSNLYVNNITTNNGGSGTITIRQPITNIYGQIGTGVVGGAAGSALKSIDVVNDGATGPATVNLKEGKPIHSPINLGNNANIVSVSNGGQLFGDVNNQGHLVFEGAAIVNANIGDVTALKSIKLNGAGEVEMKGNGGVTRIKATAIEFAHADALLELSTNNNEITGNLVNTLAGDAVAGRLKISDVDARIIGQLGTPARHLKAIEFNSSVAGANNGLELTGGTGLFVDAVTTNRSGAHSILISQPNTLLVSDIGAENARLETILIRSDGAGGSATVTLSADKTIYSDIGLGMLDSTLVLENNTKVIGGISSGVIIGPVLPNATNGNLTVNGSSVIDGDVAKAFALNRITLADAASDVEFRGTAANADMKFGAMNFAAAGAKVKLSTNNRALTGDLVNTAAQGSAGILEVHGNQQYSIDGRIGAVDHNLEKIKFVGAGEDSAITFKNSENLFVDAITTDTAHKGNIVVDQNITNILGNIGTVEKPLERLVIVNTAPVAGSALVNFSEADVYLDEINFVGQQDNQIKLKNTILNVAKLTTDVANKGDIQFEATNVIVGTVGTPDLKLASIKSTAPNSALEIFNNVSSNNVTLHENAMIVLSGQENNVNEIVGVNNNNGVVVFANPNSSKLKIGMLGTKDHALQGIRLRGGDVSLDVAAIYAASMRFTSDQNANIEINADLGNTNISTVSTTSNQNVIVSGIQTIKGNFGSEANPLGNLVINEDEELVILNTEVLHAGITTNTANKGKLILAKMPAGLRNVGTTEKPLKFVAIRHNNQDLNLYAESIVLSKSMDNLKLATFKSNDLIISSGSAINNNNKEEINVSFLGNTLPQSIRIDSAETNRHSVTFKDDITVEKDIAEDVIVMKAITFNSNVAFKDDLSLYGTDINFVNSDTKDASIKEVKFAQDVTGKTVDLNGKVNIANRNFATGANKLVFNDKVNLNNSSVSADANGEISFVNMVTAKDTAITIDSGSTVKFSGGQTSTFTGNTTINLAINNQKIGTIAAEGKNTVVDFSKVAKGSSINVSLLGTGRVNNQQYSILANTDGGKVILGDNFTYSHSDRFSTWEIIDAEKGIFAIKDNSGAATQTILKELNTTEESRANAKALDDALDDSTAGHLFSELLNVGRVDEKAFAEAYERISHNTVVVTAEATKSATAQVTARMGDASNALINQNDSIVNPISAAPAAGERDVLRYGVWANPFYGQGLQKERKGISGYRTKSMGATVGFDTMANDTMLVGVAATMAKTDIKHRDVNAGDKSKVNTLLFSVYGLQLVNDQLFVQGAAAFGSSRVKNSSIRVGYSNGAVTRSSVSGNYDSMSWGGELLAGFNVSSFGLGNVTPMLGMDYSRVTDSGFKEASNTNQNFTVYSKPVESLRAIAGVKATVFSTSYNNMYITPEVHAFVKHGLVNKNPSLNVSLDGTPITVKNIKPSRTAYNLGASLNTTNGMMQYGITYDANIAQKYVGHQGSIKMRVNF